MSFDDRGNLRYFNNAGAGLPSSKTLTIQIDHLRREAQIGAYPAATEAAERLKEFNTDCMELIGADDPTQIAFMDSASRAWDMALYGSSVGPGDIITTLSSEFGTNLVSVFHFAGKVGAEVRVVPCHHDGTFSMSDMTNAIAGASLLAVSHVAAHASIVNPVEELGVLARKHGVAYLLDGCQSLGQFKVDVNAIGCDAYTATGRKWLCGPRGTGFLYVRPTGRFNTPYVDLANASLKLNEAGRTYVAVNPTAKQFELWERNIAGVLGLSNAVKEAQCLLNDTHAMKTWSLKADRIRTAVASNSKLILLGSASSASKTTGFIASQDLLTAAKHAFAAEDLTVSFMGTYDAPMHVPSGYSTIVRIAPHAYTPDSAVEAMAEILTQL